MNVKIDYMNSKTLRKMSKMEWDWNRGLNGQKLKHQLIETKWVYRVYTKDGLALILC